MEESKTKKCPFCAEKINIDAIKCKYCKELLEPDENIENHSLTNSNDTVDENVQINEINWLTRVVFPCLTMVIGWLILFFGGWQFMIGKKISVLNQIFLTGNLTLKEQSFMILNPGVLFRFNRKYYGIIADGHFFDAPFVQWFMLAVGIGIFFRGLFKLITGESYDD
jgi:hypothetical protein